MSLEEAAYPFAPTAGHDRKGGKQKLKMAVNDAPDASGICKAEVDAKVLSWSAVGTVQDQEQWKGKDSNNLRHEVTIVRKSLKTSAVNEDHVAIKKDHVTVKDDILVVSKEAKIEEGKVAKKDDIIRA